MMQKIAQRPSQAIFVDGVGRNSNRLPHSFWGKNHQWGQRVTKNLHALEDISYRWNRQLTMALPFQNNHYIC